MSAVDAFNLALTRAQSKSKRAGIGWVLMDSNQQILACDAILAGTKKTSLKESVSAFRSQLNHLFISISPASEFFDLESLLDTITQSNCELITIGHQLPVNVRSSLWESWSSTWKGRVEAMQPNVVAERLAFGAESLLLEKRPWLTCVSAADLLGHSIALAELRDEFGFSHYLRKLASESNAIIFAQSQMHLVKHMPETNSAEEALECYEIQSADNLPTLLRYFANLQACHITILCDMNLLNGLLNQNLVDEVIHHISHRPASHPEQYVSNSMSGFHKLADWTLISSSIVGNCGRLIWSRQITTQPEKSGLRLN